MKKFFFFLSFILLLNNITTAQIDQLNCTAPSRTSWNGQIGGRLLPSSGTLNVLFVFCQFPDDNFNISNSTWTKNQAPADMQSWVDQNWSSNPTQGSMTHYFNEMSFNSLKFKGKTVFQVTPHTRQWYLDNNKQRGFIHKEILQQLDQTWDFAEYDNWDYQSDYNHTNQPDGIVDMVFMVWRNIAHEYPIEQQGDISTALNMGRYGDLGGSSFTVDNGQRTIKTGFWPSGNTPGGSGATLTDWFSENMFRFCIHEFGHYLEGGNEEHVGYGFWGLCSGWGIKSFIPNAFERYRLGWINLNTIQPTPRQTITNASLPDFITTGIAYRLVIDESSKQYFYIENHQNLSYWENTQDYLRHPYGNVEDGVYVLRQDGAQAQTMQILPADGRFDWIVNQLVPNPWGSGNLPVFKKLNADRVNGYHDLQFIPWNWNGQQQNPAPIHFTENSEGDPVIDVRYSGDGRDAFRFTYNELWSPYSNPNSQRANKTSTPFGLKLNSLINNVFLIDLYVNTSLTGPPSKPQDLTVQPDANLHPYLSWDSDIETDISNYKIYRYITYENGWQYIGTSSHHNYYTDVTQTYCSTQPGTQCTNSHNIFYKVTAIDYSQKESVPSDSVIANVRGANPSKDIPEQVSEIRPRQYQLSQNFPNPFNPTTSINYQLKDKGFISLKVYDMLGREVATLINETQDIGEYSVLFDAGKLPSGIYICSLRVNDFVKNIKMTMLK